MEPKFRMGLGKLRNASSDKLANEEAISFELFKQTGEHALFEGEEHIWRHMRFKAARQSMPPEIRKDIVGISAPQALQRIAVFATQQFKKLSDFGVPFEGRFIVHDVNRVASLVAAVPKVVDTSPQNHEATESEWQRYVDEYVRLQETLLAYFDSRVTGRHPILYDAGRFSQYVYGNTSSAPGTLPRFMLVDSDPLFDPTDGTGDYTPEAAYRLFAYVAMDGVYEFLHDFSRNARDAGVSLDVIADAEKRAESFTGEWKMREAAFTET